MRDHPRDKPEGMQGLALGAEGLDGVPGLRRGRLRSGRSSSVPAPFDRLRAESANEKAGASQADSALAVRLTRGRTCSIARLRQDLAPEGAGRLLVVGVGVVAGDGEQRHREAMLRIDGGTPSARAISRAATCLASSSRSDAPHRRSPCPWASATSTSSRARAPAAAAGRRARRPGSPAPARISGSLYPITPPSRFESRSRSPYRQNDES
jgi:hypothetical protein